jgi:predicted nucleic acid-binding protein
MWATLSERAVRAAGHGRTGETESVSDRQKIYMDVCAINRPFDDMGVGRNLVEGNAVWAIVKLCRKIGWEILWSDAMEAEFKRTGDDKLLAKVRGLLPRATTTLPTTDEIRTRAASFDAGGVEGYNGLHLALAERHGTVFLTTDDRLLKKATRLCAALDLNARLKVRPLNPVEWLREVMNA